MAAKTRKPPKRKSLKPYAKSFGRKITELREENNMMSLRDLARKIGKSATYVSEVERGVASPPTEEVIRKLADVLHTDVDELIALAGRIPEDVQEIIRKRPEIADFLRTVGGRSKLELERLRDATRRPKRKRGTKN